MDIPPSLLKDIGWIFSPLFSRILDGYSPLSSLGKWMDILPSLLYNIGWIFSPLFSRILNGYSPLSSLGFWVNNLLYLLDILLTLLFVGWLGYSPLSSIGCWMDSPLSPPYIQKSCLKDQIEYNRITLLKLGQEARGPHQYSLLMGSIEYIQGLLDAT